LAIGICNACCVELIRPPAVANSRTP
jgi:hypothetical protein